MIKKILSFSNMVFAISLSMISLNLISSSLNPEKYFSLIFVLIGMCNIFLGITLLNDNKKLLSFFNFLIAAFMFISVGSRIILI
ncbi:hypothetical protein [uncultured Clostridium sp.]|uniref:hypothetical protein n=1 Tax=uncultured Clostridium sp. TaxID=59620 RepID=UPI0025ED8618|nr:hypothetical protein [uncultured Clostridium sp.]